MLSFSNKEIAYRIRLPTANGWFAGTDPGQNPQFS
jgi:hypothetical protein